MTMSSAAAVSSSSVSSSSTPESPTENKQASNPDNQDTEETEAPLLIELWKIISIGGLLIVFILLIFILGLLVSQIKKVNHFIYGGLHRFAAWRREGVTISAPVPGSSYPGSSAAGDIAL